MNWLTDNKIPMMTPQRRLDCADHAGVRCFARFWSVAMECSLMTANPPEVVLQTPHPCHHRRSSAR